MPAPFRPFKYCTALATAKVSGDDNAPDLA